ncbi:uncharacterized protein LOC133034315 [Cannabis sativa]|uniref:uncharacterized protein LOC133034315 n=1 Tax=Cannabis sativa TaxID=3483 RepID=UPI0029C9F314|nr:uncharacterized protein LOC133034315 [Cannabis sativa]
MAWVHEGDNNTALFHGSIKQRLRENRIFYIEQKNGERVNDLVMVQEAFLEYYKSLLGTNMENRKSVVKSVLRRGPVVSQEHAELLMRKITIEEVKKAAFDIPGSKSPGPDGYSSYFFQDNWDSIGDSIFQAVSSFLESSRILKEINSTMITLVPKDLIRHYGRKANKPGCVIKLDIQKAYDTVEWQFIEEMLQGLQFPSPFIRLMRKIGEKEDFGFHDRCSELKLNHLAFADDPSPTKTAIYCSNMEHSVVERLLTLSRFSRQNLPFTYLGIPINAKKISGSECEILIEKMTTRIRSWSSRNLSFAGRTVLINYVLLAIQAHWSQILIFPKKIIKGIEAVCRAYLWKGQAMFQGGGAIKWDMVCSPKSVGGLGIKTVEEWNKAAMCKYVWAIANNKESLWMRWIQRVYLKKGDWWSHSPSIHVSWYWKKLVALKDQVKGLTDIREFTAHKFSIAAGYRMLAPSLTKSLWSKEVWARLTLPKHSFILWLAMHGRLKTKDRLFSMGIQLGEGPHCKEGKETAQHLFFECSVAEMVLKSIKNGWDGR